MVVGGAALAACGWRRAARGETVDEGGGRQPTRRQRRRPMRIRVRAGRVNDIRKLLAALYQRSFMVLPPNQTGYSRSVLYQRTAQPCTDARCVCIPRVGYWL